MENRNVSVIPAIELQSPAVAARSLVTVLTELSWLSYAADRALLISLAVIKTREFKVQSLNSTLCSNSAKFSILAFCSEANRRYGT